ncbi:MAG TPA: Gfo/Idh/MocA family oxidoreductase [Micropepsaceae bacterium]|nr:Gfo/Idh/MocA family oxidoreductase [Micropepsaceae bacterium]
MPGQSSPDAPLRAGVVGAGFFGRLHAQKLAAIPGVTLTAIADPSANAAREAAEKFGCDPVASWRDLLGKVDVVSVASPASTHADAAIGLLGAGVHVLVEKPIATSLAAADAMIYMSRENKRVLTAGHQERYVFAQSGLLNRAIKPTRIECVREGVPNGRGLDVSIVLDLMIHDLDLVHQIFPRAPARIAAMTRAPDRNAGDDVVADLDLGGAQVRLTASRIASERKRTMRLVYPDGEIFIDFLARTLSNTTGEALKPAFQGFDGLDDAAARIASDPLGYAIGRFVHEVRTGMSALVRPEEARLALETALGVINAAEMSAKG